MQLCLILLAATLSWCGTVGDGVPYQPPIAKSDVRQRQEHAEQLLHAAFQDARQQDVPVSIQSVQEFKQLVQQNARALALLAAAGLIAVAVVTCAMSGDACVRRRLNYNRRQPIVVEEVVSE